MPVVMEFSGKWPSKCHSETSNMSRAHFARISLRIPRRHGSSHEKNLMRIEIETCLRVIGCPPKWKTTKKQAHTIISRNYGDIRSSILSAKNLQRAAAAHINRKWYLHMSVCAWFVMNTKHCCLAVFIIRQNRCEQMSHDTLVMQIYRHCWASIVYEFGRSTTHIVPAINAFKVATLFNLTDGSYDFWKQLNFLLCVARRNSLSQTWTFPPTHLPQVDHALAPTAFMSRQSEVSLFWPPIKSSTSNSVPMSLTQHKYPLISTLFSKG